MCRTAESRVAYEGPTPSAHDTFRVSPRDHSDRRCASLLTRRAAQLDEGAERDTRGNVLALLDACAANAGVLAVLAHESNTAAANTSDIRARLLSQLDDAAAWRTAANELRRLLE